MSMYYLLMLFLIACSSPKAKTTDRNPELSIGADDFMVNGISMIAAPHAVDSTEFIAFKNVHANFVCLLPFAFVRNDEANVYYNTGHQWWGESPQGIAASIKLAHQNNLKVLVKPQIWMHKGFSGDLMFKSDEDWKRFEQSYTRYIFKLLPLADSLHAEMFCLGNELDSFVMQRTDYWRWLIDTARKVYRGKLVYAENWDCYELFPLWDKLDYIGTNAYFPLSNEKTPAIEELLEKWKPIAEKLRSYSVKYSKPVLFTEYGYRSIDYAAKEPWESYRKGAANYNAQKNAYEAFFKTFWKEDWCAGGFSWKWLDSKSQPDVPIEIDYTPQGKPAMDVLRVWYQESKR